MSRRTRVWTIAVMACALSAAWAQDTTPPADDSSANPPQQPAPAYGQDNSSAAPVSENPPISGLDLPSLEPHAAPLSYLQPGATFSEAADSNAASQLGGGQSFTSLTHALGTLELRRLWSNYDLAMDYVGGVGYYSLQGQGATLLQQMDLDQKITWKRGQLSLRDSFSYLPEGNFGASYGSIGAEGVGSLANTPFGAFMGGSVLGTFGLVPRILNVADVDVTENLTPKSSITAAAGYAFTHFYGSDVTSGTSFIGVSQLSAQVAYDRILTPYTQVAMVYGYQGFDFSVSGMAFHSHVIQGMYGRRITGRMDLLIGAGPQITKLDSQSAVCSDPTVTSILLCELIGDTVIPTTIKDTRIGVAATFRLRYKFPRTSLDLSYQRYETGGSGIFAGAQTDLAKITAERPLSRVWRGFVDLGYSRNSRLQTLSTQQLGSCVYQGQANPTGLPLCPGFNANTYNYGFAGVGVHRQFGHDFHGFFSYQFNELAFDSSFCVSGSPCNRISNRQVITFGLDWTPRPIRLD
ncbi:MAG TPA: hypothetical protein VGS05_10385 [Candidatus Sulfotelmatobacter sp.]|nr:hypothetical protein [Candidatus Sulfotelmatobacter sp.]